MTTPEKAEALAIKLEGFGVPARGYGRGPNGKAMFTIAIQGDEVLVWPGAAEKVEVYGSSKNKQAVINVIEKARTVTKTVTAKVNQYGPTVPGDATFTQRFPIVFPNPRNVTWSVTDKKHVAKKTDPKDRVGYGERTFTAKVKATVKASNQSMLVGYDEHALFVSILPKRVKSVAEAHRVLRPRGVSDKAVRQGEWFFDPVSDTVGNSIDRYLRRNPSRLEFGSPDGAKWTGTHRTTRITMNRRTYAIGYVVDVRGEKTETHHEPLWLNDWHRVTKNTELEPPRNMGNQRRSFD